MAITYQQFGDKVNEVETRAAAYEAMPFEARPVAEIHVLMNELLQLILTTVDNTPDDFCWGKDPYFVRLGRVRAHLGVLINPNASAKVVYAVH